MSDENNRIDDDNFEAEYENMMNTTEYSSGKIIDVDINREMRKSFLDYSMSVIVARALPDVRDGLKPVHRRILYTMYENGLDPSKPYRKCADTVGSVLGKYHPHGDTSVYDAMVRLAQDFSMRYMLVDGHGNFGSVDGDPPAAYRYTESKMSKISMEMLADIDKDTVDFIPNFDDRLKEPTVLPSRFPNLLVNGSSGIAVGMATNIPPHNIGEVIDAMCLLIDDPDISTVDLMEVMPGPDFPTGGIIMGKTGIYNTYTTGRGRIIVRSKTEIVEAKNGRFKIIVTELPYGVNKARLIENIADLVKDKRIEGISNVEDHSDRKGMHIEIDVKKDASAEIVLNQLFKMTALQSSFGAILLAIVDGEPKTLTLKEMLTHYINHQITVIKRRTAYDLKKAKERAHILEGLKIAVDNIDRVIQIIRKSKDQSEARAALCEEFNLDEPQAQAIVSMRLGQLTNTDRFKLEEEIAALKEKMKEYEEILASETKCLELVKEEAIAIRNKYTDPRRTEISQSIGDVEDEDLIPKEDCVVTITKFGYIKRQSEDTYKIQRRGGRGISGMSRKEEDIATDMYVSNSHSFNLFFTNTGRVYRIKCYRIPDSSRQSKGINIANLLPISAGEKVTSGISVADFDEDKYLIMVTKHGIIKRIKLNAYNTARKGGLIALDLNEGDELSWVKMTSGKDEVVIATRNGIAIRFKETDVRPMGRLARGVKAIKLRDGDEIIGMDVIDDSKYVLTVSETGFGRLSRPSDYRLQKRGGLGIKNYHIDKYGKVASLIMVDVSDDLILIAENGVIIRIPVEQIRICSRPSKGVKVMRIDGEDKVASVANIPNILADEDDEKKEEKTDESSDKENS